MKFKKGKFVTVASQGRYVFKIDKVDKSNKELLVNGWWESMENCTLIPKKKVKKQTSYFCNEY